MAVLVFSFKLVEVDKAALVTSMYEEVRWPLGVRAIANRERQHWTVIRPLRGKRTVDRGGAAVPAIMFVSFG